MQFSPPLFPRVSENITGIGMSYVLLRYDHPLRSPIRLPSVCQNGAFQGHPCPSTTTIIINGSRPIPIRPCISV
ncbi:jg25887 [Pararge aegeria aegeria]|uniref:Jg25887 protein n=1 Tax=Pararge aegeria aegeria TaxID=348720 RepID=A0A8S4RTE9_9NEOP|nr:jg25887 [Pararge aegeria aegeria]